MMNPYRHFVRPLLFRLDAERAHRLSVAASRFVGDVPLLPGLLERGLSYSARELETNVAGLDFANPLGLAAGWDKSGQAVRLLGSLGFGAVEIGSVSAEPSAGNPKPRLFRLPQDEAIIVNYGLPNDGAQVVAERLKRYRQRLPNNTGKRPILGVNLVVTNRGLQAMSDGTTPCSGADIVADYCQSASLLEPYADYLTLNLSCPNTGGGQDFFSAAANIAELLMALQSQGLTRPVFLKVAPDPSPAAMDRLLSTIDPFGFVRGVMFNLPSGKPASLRLSTPQSCWKDLPGAVAGPPARALLNACIAEFYQRKPAGRFCIIGSGGVATAEAAYEKIRLGASLVQLYTALVYRGPQVVAEINRGLVDLLRRDGLGNISQAVGMAVKPKVSQNN